MNIALRRFLHNHGNIATEGSPKPGLCPTLIFKWFQGFFIMNSSIGCTVHAMPLNSLEHCICTTTMTNILHDRDSNMVPPGYKPQLIRMSHKVNPETKGCFSIWNHHNKMSYTRRQIKNNQPGSHDFRRFLHQFWTDFLEILQRQFFLLKS